RVNDTVKTLGKVPEEINSTFGGNQLQQEIYELRALVAENLMRIKEGVREIQNSNPSTVSQPDREVFRELLSQLPLNDIKGLDNLH
ncbi:unnamed protein product, partial [Allacma fusca]